MIYSSRIGSVWHTEVVHESDT